MYKLFKTNFRYYLRLDYILEIVLAILKKAEETSLVPWNKYLASLVVVVTYTDPCASISASTTIYHLHPPVSHIQHKMRSTL